MGQQGRDWFRGLGQALWIGSVVEEQKLVMSTMNLGHHCRVMFGDANVLPNSLLGEVIASLGFPLANCCSPVLQAQKNKAGWMCMTPRRWVLWSSEALW